MCPWESPGSPQAPESLLESLWGRSWALPGAPGRDSMSQNHGFTVVKLAFSENSLSPVIENASKTQNADTRFLQYLLAFSYDFHVSVEEKNLKTHKHNIAQKGDNACLAYV